MSPWPRFKPDLMQRMGRFLKSFYFITTVLFVCFVLFIDSNDLFTQWRLLREDRSLAREQRELQEKIKLVHQQKELLRTDTAMLERIARERYLLKRPGEDLYVIEKKTPRKAP